MIRLTKLFDSLENEDVVAIRHKGNEVYRGECGKCTHNIWANAYIQEMKYNPVVNGYIIYIIYQ